MISESKRAGLKAFITNQAVDGIFRAIEAKVPQALLDQKRCGARLDEDKAQMAAFCAVTIEMIAELHFELAADVLELTERLDALQAKRSP